MTNERMLGTLTFLALGLLLSALALSGATFRLPVASFSWWKGAPSIDVSDWLSKTWSISGSGSVVAGFVFGWGLRWLYALPWGAIPRTIITWLLGWRNSMLSIVLIGACIGVLLLN
jgi:hypothetical protein